MTRGIVIAGTQSGVGKTTIAAGLIAALRNRGLTVQPFKVGPDYIDPTYHTQSAGRPCRNLDTWLVPPERVGALFTSACRDADFAVVEGVMGLFDGIGYENETGSTAQMAKLIDLPIVLVIDAAKMARSAAAVVTGYRGFDKDVHLAGIIVNRVGSDNHGRGVAMAIETATGLPVLGWIKRDERLKIAERHLGLIPAVKAGPWAEFLRTAEETIAAQLDLERLVQIAGEGGSSCATSMIVGEAHRNHANPKRTMPVIAVARDEAFHFTYEENLELLQDAGAQLEFFSPLHDRTLPDRANGVILSGGFPEMFAPELAANTPMLEAIRAAYQQDLPIYAECGGLMYLTEAILAQDGTWHRMVGILPGRSRMSGRLNLGYRRARAATSSWLFEAGEEIHGHEFHYSQWADRPADLPPAYRLQAAAGMSEPWIEGACLGSLWASYVHVHFWGKPALATRFVNACRRRQSRKVGVA